MDSSGSLKDYYNDEKNFLITLARVFNLTAAGSHAGVVTFSKGVEFSIRLNQYTDMTSFDRAVHRIPLMGGATRIDLALQYGWQKMFNPAYGARSNVPRLMVLLTDGSQSKMRGSRDPAIVSALVRQAGIQMIVIGIGKGVNKGELRKIAGADDKWYTAKNWDELKSKGFVRDMSKSLCKHAEGRTMIFFLHYSR